MRPRSRGDSRASTDVYPSRERHAPRGAIRSSVERSIPCTRFARWVASASRFDQDSCSERASDNARSAVARRRPRVRATAPPRPFPRSLQGESPPRPRPCFASCAPTTGIRYRDRRPKNQTIRAARHAPMRTAYTPWTVIATTASAYAENGECASLVSFPASLCPTSDQNLIALSLCTTRAL